MTVSGAPAGRRATLVDGGRPDRAPGGGAGGRAKFSAGDIYAALVDNGVPAAPIKSINAALADPQARHREIVVKVTHCSSKEFLTVGTAFKVRDAFGEEFSSPPAVGADSEAVLTGLGYSDDEIRAMVDEIIKLAAQ